MFALASQDDSAFVSLLFAVDGIFIVCIFDTIVIVSGVFQERESTIGPTGCRNGWLWVLTAPERPAGVPEQHVSRDHNGWSLQLSWSLAWINAGSCAGGRRRISRI